MLPCVVLGMLSECSAATAQDLALKGETGVAAVVDKPSAPAQNASVAAKAKRDWLSANYALPLLPSMVNMMQPAQARTVLLARACTGWYILVYMTSQDVSREANIIARSDISTDEICH